MYVLMMVLRLAHVASGVFWAGTLFMSAGFLLPAVRASGPAGGQVMRNLMVVRKLSVAIPIAAMLTVFSGALLYWRDTAISAGAFVHSPMGLVFGIGGTAALLALIPGIGVVARTGEKITQLGDAILAGGKPPTSEQMATMAAFQQRMHKGSHAAAGLVGIALVAMAVARYV